MKNWKPAGVGAGFSRRGRTKFGGGPSGLAAAAPAKAGAYTFWLPS